MREQDAGENEIINRYSRVEGVELIKSAGAIRKLEEEEENS